MSQAKQPRRSLLDVGGRVIRWTEPTDGSPRNGHWYLVRVHKSTLTEYFVTRFNGTEFIDHDTGFAGTRLEIDGYVFLE